ncbi:hypothetical protein A2U01_0096106, partial [Trifolium medium]|nr:hypothetical protein [Trifolium medium]
TLPATASPVLSVTAVAVSNAIAPAVQPGELVQFYVHHGDSDFSCSVSLVDGFNRWLPK